MLRAPGQLKGDLAREEERERKRALAGLGESTLATAARDVGAWHRTFGKPKPYPSGLTTEFAGSGKIYGGTPHHAAFRSLATTMKPGRATR